MRLKEGELAALIRLSTADRVVSLRWLIDGAELQDVPGNDWARAELASMRKSKDEQG